MLILYFCFKKIFLVIDSWGGVPSGRYEGNTIDFGHFDQCLGVKPEHFNPLYCLIPLNDTENSIEFQSAVCMPDSCSAESIKTIISNVLRESNSSFEVNGNISGCIKRKPWDFGTLELSTFITVVIVLFLTISSTYFHFVQGKNVNEAERSLTAFSLIRNVGTLFDTSKSNAEIFECLNGIRVLSVILMLFGNEMNQILTFKMPLHNAKEFETIRKSSTWISAIMMTEICLDTFLVITGMIISYSFMDARTKR